MRVLWATLKAGQTEEPSAYEPKFSTIQSACIHGRAKSLGAACRTVTPADVKNPQGAL
jgi:hypothetical protein